MKLMLICILLPMVTMAEITDTGCGTDKACFMQPDACTLGTDCTFFLSLADNGQDAVDFEIWADMTSTSGVGWAAVAFSTDTVMGDDSVVMCRKPDSGDADVTNGINVGEVNQVTDAVGLSNTAVTVANQIMECNFTRAYIVTGDNANVDLASTSYYFFMGTGDISQGVELEHAVNPWVSSAVVDITSVMDFSGGEGESNSHESNVATPTPAVSMVIALCGLVMALFH